MTLVKWNPTRSLMTDFDRIFDSMFTHDLPQFSSTNLGCLQSM